MKIVVKLPTVPSQIQPNHQSQDSGSSWRWARDAHGQGTNTKSVSNHSKRTAHTHHVLSPAVALTSQRGRLFSSPKHTLSKGQWVPLWTSKVRKVAASANSCQLHGYLCDSGCYIWLPSRENDAVGCLPYSYFPFLLANGKLICSCGTVFCLGGESKPIWIFSAFPVALDWMDLDPLEADKT